MKKRSQSWYIDYIVGFVIFTIAFLLFLQYSPNIKKDSMTEIILDSEILSEILISEGIPHDWNSTNYFQIGLTTNYKINKDKLLELKKIDYYVLRDSIPINSDFYFEFNKPISFPGDQFISYGFPGSTKDNIKEEYEPDKIVYVERLVAFEGEILRLRLWVWSR
jgi:hypothetical protein